MEGKENGSSLSESATKPEAYSSEKRTGYHPELVPSMSPHDSASPDAALYPAPQAQEASSGCPAYMPPPPGFIQPHPINPQTDSGGVSSEGIIPPSGFSSGYSPHPPVPPATESLLPVLPPSTSVVQPVQSNPLTSVYLGILPSETAQDIVSPDLAPHPAPQVRDTSPRYSALTPVVDFERTPQQHLVQPHAAHPPFDPRSLSTGSILPSTSPSSHPPYPTASPGTGRRMSVLPPLQSHQSIASMPPVHSYDQPYPWPYNYNSWGQPYPHGTQMYPHGAPMQYDIGTYPFGSSAHAYPHHQGGVAPQDQAQAGYNGNMDGGQRRPRKSTSASCAVNPGKPYIKDNKPRAAPKGADLFVFYVPNATTNADLYRLFAPYGTILSARIATEKDTGRGRGFAYVDYASPESADDAIHHLHRHKLLGKRLKVTHKEDKQGKEKERHDQDYWSTGQPRRHQSWSAQEYAGQPGAQHESISAPPLPRYHNAPMQQYGRQTTDYWSSVQPQMDHSWPVQEYRPVVQHESISTPPLPRHRSAPMQGYGRQPVLPPESISTPPLPPLEHFPTQHPSVQSLPIRTASATNQQPPSGLEQETSDAGGHHDGGMIEHQLRPPDANAAAGGVAEAQALGSLTMLQPPSPLADLDDIRKSLPDTK